MQESHVPVGFDHLMYGGGLDLDALGDAVAARTGVDAAFGGCHDRGGTCNALLGLGRGRYLELIAADPAGDTGAPRARLVAGLPAPRAIAWAIAVPDLDRALATARAAGYDPGPIRPLRRRRSDGSWLSWRLAWDAEQVFLGVVPFVIEWGEAAHPAADAPAGCRLLGLRAEHPRPAQVRPALRALGVGLALGRGPAPALIATLETPNGVVKLR